MTIQPVASLKEFFRDALHDALSHQHVAVEDHTEHYVVNVLTTFARSEELFETTSEGVRLRPLAATSWPFTDPALVKRAPGANVRADYQPPSGGLDGSRKHRWARSRPRAGC